MLLLPLYQRDNKKSTRFCSKKQTKKVSFNKANIALLTKLSLD